MILSGELNIFIQSLLLVFLYTMSGLQKSINQETRKQENITYSLEAELQKCKLFTI